MQPRRFAFHGFDGEREWGYSLVLLGDLDPAAAEVFVAVGWHHLVEVCPFGTYIGYELPFTQRELEFMGYDGDTLDPLWRLPTMMHPAVA